MPSRKSLHPPVRLVKAVTNFYSGGTEGQVYRLVKNMDPSRFDLELVSLDKRGPFREEYEQLGVPISEYRLKSLHSASTFPQLMRLARYLRSERVQVVHSYNFYATSFAVPAAKLAGVPVVIASIRDRGAYMNKRQKQLQKAVCRLADKVLVNADSIRDWLVGEGYKESAIQVIKNGIDLSRYDDSQHDKADQGPSMHEEWRIPLGAPVVCMVSRLNQQKGVLDLIKAGTLIIKRHPDVHFIFVGETSASDKGMVEEWRQAAVGLGIGDRVIFTGHRADPERFLTQSSVSVLPSYNEGLSNTVLESMAAGTPMVSTNVGGTPELITDNETGLLVPPGSPVALCEAISRVLDDPALAARLSKAGRQKVEKEFSIKTMVDYTQELYTDLLMEKDKTFQRINSGSETN